MLVVNFKIKNAILMRKRRQKLVRTISVMLVMVWLVFALQPSVMAAIATYQAAPDCDSQMADMPDCCEQAKITISAEKGDCSPAVCAAMQSLDQQDIDQPSPARLVQQSMAPPTGVIGLASDFCGAHSSVYQRHQSSPLPPHPTLQFCTLLI